MIRMNIRLSPLLAIAFIACTAAAQQGGGPHPLPAGGASFGAAPRDDMAPRHQRDELRSLIRDQRRSDHPAQSAQGDGPASRQLSREERQALRDQLRRQRPENWRHNP
jgi:hypothetical protein